MIHLDVIIQLVGTREDVCLMTGVGACVDPYGWALSLQCLREFGLDEFAGVHDAVGCLGGRSCVVFNLSY